MSTRPLSARTLLAAALLSFSLASCNGASVSDTLGLGRKAPDEFRVYARPPLTVPPEFNLRAPGSASDAPTTVKADAQARSAVLGTDELPVTSSGMVNTRVTKVETGDIPTGADAQFLQNAGVHKNNPQVRSLLDQDKENGVTAANSSYLINSAADGEPTVDAAKEADRLKKNKAENKAPTVGDTPVVEPKSKGILGTLGDLF